MPKLLKIYLRNLVGIITMLNKVICKLEISHKWLIWEPKRGSYKGKTKYISKINSWNGDKYQGCPVVLGGYRVRNGKSHMHVHSITYHQFENNTTPLIDKVIINDMENKFIEYKQMWEERRIVKTAKQLLMEVSSVKRRKR